MRGCSTEPVTVKVKSVYTFLSGHNMATSSSQATASKERVPYRRLTSPLLLSLINQPRETQPSKRATTRQQLVTTPPLPSRIPRMQPSFSTVRLPISNYQSKFSTPTLTFHPPITLFHAKLGTKMQNVTAPPCSPSPRRTSRHSFAEPRLVWPSKNLARPIMARRPIYSLGYLILD